MHDRPFTTLPEDLLLLCADPQSGVLERPQHFNRALGGAVLTELLLRGAIAVDDKRITEVRPLALGEPVADRADRVLVELSGTGKQERRLRLEGWVRYASGGLDNLCLKALASRGLVRAQRKRALGIIPYTTWTTVQPGWTKDLAVRIDRVVRPEAYEPASRPPDPRDVHLAALVGTIHELFWRIYPHRDQHDTRCRIMKLTRATPIANAARKVIESDESAGGGGYGGDGGGDGGGGD
ncbi:GPP34 family phosphoprotein [Streptomyces sp. NPDC019645]|uniref:GOLPH3/VPS74 family protein n=1 Tax=unclassified Streptomyces TaxID=2593676 RepID=UPI0033BFFBF2